MSSIDAIKILFKAQETAFSPAPVEVHVQRFADRLWQRWPDLLKGFASMSETDKDALFARLLALQGEAQSDTKALVDEMTRRSLAYGLLIAGATGETYPPLPQAEVDALLNKQETFLDSKAYEYAEAHAFNTVTTKDAQLMGSLKASLLDGLYAGDNPRQIAARWEAETEERSGDWERIARTETARALAAGFYEETKRLGLDLVYIPPQPKACDACKRLLIGRVFPLSALEGASNVGRKPNNWIPAIPLHPNCTCLPIPASRYLANQATAKAEGGQIPNEGIPVEALSPRLR